MTHRTVSRTSWTAMLAVAVEIAEPVCKGQDYIAAESIIHRFLMIVGLVGDIKVLRLSENVICLQSKGELVLEQKLGNLGIQHEFIFLLFRLAVVPVVVGIRDKVDASRDRPVHRKVYLVVPGSALVIFCN